MFLGEHRYIIADPTLTSRQHQCQETAPNNVMPSLFLICEAQRVTALSDLHNIVLRRRRISFSAVTTPVPCCNSTIRGAGFAIDSRLLVSRTSM